MPTIIYVQPDGTTCEVAAEEGLSVMEAAKEHGVPGIEADCGGACACATCHIYVDPEWLEVVGGPSSDEAEMLECATEPRPNSRLSCQIACSDALDGLIVHLPATQR